jgi:phosphate-selective porin OprO/OprP
MRRAPLLIALGALLATPTARAGSFDLQPIFTGEIDYRLHAVKHLEGEDGFSVARLRLGAQGSFTRWFFAAAQVEMIGGEGPRVLDAMVGVRPSPEWEVTFGASRTPLFSSARDEPLAALPVPELSMVTRAFWPGFDAGLEVHRLPTPRLPVEAWLRVGNGSGSALGNDNSDYALDARLDAAFGRAVTGAPASLPYGLRFGAGLHAESAEDRAGVGGTTAGGFLFYRPVTVSGPRTLTEAHVIVYAGPVKVTAEAALARETRSRDTDGNPDTPRVAQDPVVSKGATVEVAWMITGPRRRHGLWPVQSPAGTWDWGALELAARAERLSLGGGAKDVKAGGATAGSAALRWWVTSFCAVSAAAYFSAYDAAPIEEPDRTRSWLGIVRATVRVPDDALHLR